jgi:uncharacterized repeat protein (TIGR01451 family)
MTLLAGCMSMSPRSRTSAWRPVDPPASPGTVQNFSARRPPAGEAVVPTPVPELPKKSQPLPKTEKSQPVDADPDVPPARTVPDADFEEDPFGKRDSGPTLDSLPTVVPEDVTAVGPLELVVSAPSRRQLGAVATYRITLRNTGDKSQEGLVVHCRFDDSLSFPGSEKREVQQRVARLAPGETKETALSLTSDKSGSHCCQFVVTRSEGEGEVELSSKQVCVEFVNRNVSIDVIGPAQRTEGSRAEFNITLTSHSLKTIDDVEAVVSYDKALLPREATAEAERRAGSLLWQLGSLRPLETVQLQVEFECRAPAHRACVTVEVKGGDLPAEQEEACVEVTPIQGTLDLRISDRDDPLEIGKTGLYEVTVQNIGLQAARRVVLEAAIPENLKVRSATVRSGDEELTLKQVAQGSRLVFDPVELLAPNARLVYRLEVEALRAGPAEFRASLTNALSSTAITVSEPTSVVEP